jgi:hypothetical protein
MRATLWPLRRCLALRVAGARTGPAVHPAILRRSPHPFRHHDEHSPERIEEMVTVAERAYA